MEIVVIILGLIIIPIFCFVIYRIFAFRKESLAHSRKKMERVEGLYNKLENEEVISEREILEYAKNVLTRESLYSLLDSYSKGALFPKEYYTIQSAAESNLVNWLEFPTELGTQPDEIYYLEEVAIDFKAEKFCYQVFKYKMNEPHWAAKDDWLLGVVGPYFKDSKPYDFPMATFSRMSSKLEHVSPEEEAIWVHENIMLKQLA